VRNGPQGEEPAAESTSCLVTDRSLGGIWAFAHRFAWEISGPLNSGGRPPIGDQDC